MNKIMLNEIINRLIKNNINTNILYILDKDERIISRLLSLNDEYLEYGINICLMHYANRIKEIEALDLLRKSDKSKIKYIYNILINPDFFIENKSLEAATLIDLANNEIEAEYIYKFLISTKRIDNVLYKMVGYSRKEQENKPTCLEKSNKIKKKSNNIN